MASGCHCKLYSLCETKKEYQKIMRTISGSNKKSDITVEKVNASLLESCEKEIGSCKDLTLIHDPSDIRKPYSKSLENIGKIKDLKSNIINGYSTHNIVGVIDVDKSAHLLSHRSYSNKDTKFLNRKDIRKLESGKEVEEDIKALYSSNEYFNKKIISSEEITKISQEIKAINSEIRITHVLDREFDDNHYFDIIHTLQDQFIIRSKKSRTAKIADDQKTSEKLIEMPFENNFVFRLQRVSLGNKLYQDVKMKISWNKDGNYNAVRIEMRDRRNKEIFPDPMLLITNIAIKNQDDAYSVYLQYLQRAKIECVFKFLKDGLGWETVQVRDFTAIQNLLSICFFVACYLYRIGKQKIHDDYVVLLSEIGGGKGKVTRYFILKGLKCIFQKHRADKVFKRRNVSEETQKALSSIIEIC